eukprot:5139835-Pleurochrysis_carterae.AAC.1
MERRHGSSRRVGVSTELQIHRPEASIELITYDLARAPIAPDHVNVVWLASFAREGDPGEEPRVRRARAADTCMI